LPEDWLAREAEYLARRLDVPESESTDVRNRTGLIKRAISRLGRNGDGAIDVVARIVHEAPAVVFRRWLQDDAFQSFYTDCRAAATRADCETLNELETDEDG